MKYIQLILVFVTLLFIVSCKKESKSNQITNPKDYQAFLETDSNKTLEFINTEYNFWSTKLEKTPNQYPYYSKLASTNSQLFQLT